jgi:hypothetical protein
MVVAQVVFSLQPPSLCTRGFWNWNVRGWCKTWLSQEQVSGVWCSIMNVNNSPQVVAEKLLPFWNVLFFCFVNQDVWSEEVGRILLLRSRVVWQFIRPVLVVLATKLLIKNHGPQVRHLWYVSDTVECEVHHQVVS